MSVKTTGNVTYNNKQYNLWQRERAISHQAQIKNVIAVTNAGKTLVSGDSGALITLDASGGTVAVALPAHEAGLNFHFVQKGATTNAVTITATSATVQGVLFGDDSADIDAIPVSNKTNVILGTDTAIGEWVKFECDGTNWYVTGMSDTKCVSNGITAT